jgi:hypothetical protein
MFGGVPIHLDVATVVPSYLHKHSDSRVPIWFCSLCSFSWKRRSVESILKGLLSFMLEATQTAGSVVTTEAEKKRLARHSLRHNLADATFCELFPEVRVSNVFDSTTVSLILTPAHASPLVHLRNWASNASPQPARCAHVCVRARVERVYRRTMR